MRKFFLWGKVLLNAGAIVYWEYCLLFDHSVMPAVGSALLVIVSLWLIYLDLETLKVI